MRIANHGGKCCGIKTIHYMGVSPGSTEWTWRKDEENPCFRDYSGGDVSSEYNFFHLAAPSETAGERFDRYLKYLRVRRPKGIVEVVLTKHLQVGGWEPFLLERGFKRVQEFENSNSGAILRVYHLVMDYPPVEPKHPTDPWMWQQWYLQKFNYDDPAYDLPAPVKRLECVKKEDA